MATFDSSKNIAVGQTAELAKKETKKTKRKRFLF